MSKVYYDSALVYIQSATSLQAKITAIDDIIDSLIIAATAGGGTGNIQEYSLNDGQTTIRTAYRNPNEIHAAISGFEQIRQRYVNRLNGRIYRAVDEKNFRHGY